MRYDWNEIDRITDGKAQWAATDCYIIFAFDEKPEFDSMMGWTFSKSSTCWKIGRTDVKNRWRYTLEERPKNQNE